MDLLKYENSQVVSAFVNLNFESNFISLINKPTRVSRCSATVIDHIWCNFPDDFGLDSGILMMDVSDHFATFIVLNSFHSEDNKFISYRNWGSIDELAFRQSILSNIEYFTSYDFDDCKRSEAKGAPSTVIWEKNNHLKSLKMVVENFFKDRNSSFFILNSILT